MKVVSRRGVQLERQFTSLENPIYTIDNPDEILIPVLNGDIDQLEVKYQIGDYVQQYAEMVRDHQGFSIFAPYCGTFMGLHTKRHELLGNRPFIKFHSKPGLSGSPFKPVESEHITGDEVIAISRRSGIIDELDNVPLYQKLESFKNNGVTILVCDAIEDEVYSTSAFARIIEFGEQAAKGLKYAAIACDTTNLKIAVSTIRGFSKSIAPEYDGVQTLRVTGKYPVRHELYTSKRKKVCAIGVGACIELYRAIKMGQCHTTCIVTVDGDCVKRPANLCVPIGTSIKTLFDTCKLEEQPDFYIVGDMMNGRAITDTDISVTADMTCVLAIKAKSAAKKDICIHCGSCVQNCPAHLMPYRISEAFSNDNFNQLSFLAVDKCIGCGVCSFLCPCGIDVTRDVAVAKQKTAEYLESIRSIKAEAEQFEKESSDLQEVEQEKTEEVDVITIDLTKKTENEQIAQEDGEQSGVDNDADNNAVDGQEAEAVQLEDEVSAESHSDDADTVEEDAQDQQNVYLYTPEDTSELEMLKQTIESGDVVHTVELDQAEAEPSDASSESENEYDFEGFMEYTYEDNDESLQAMTDISEDAVEIDYTDNDIFNLDFDNNDNAMQINDQADELISYDEPTDWEEEGHKEQSVAVQTVEDGQEAEESDEQQPEQTEDEDKGPGFVRWLSGIFAKLGNDKHEDIDQSSDITAQTNDEDNLSQFEQAVSSAISETANADDIDAQADLDEAEASNAQADDKAEEIDYSTFDFSEYGLDDDDDNTDQQSDQIDTLDIEYDIESLLGSNDDEDLFDLDMTESHEQSKDNQLYGVDYSLDSSDDEFDWLTYSPQEVEYSELLEKSQDKDIATTSDLLEEQYLKDMEKIDNFIDYDAQLSELEIDYDSIVQSAFDEIDLLDSEKIGEGE